MKTSNKIILAILLISFGFVISAHVVLRQKYLRNDFIVPGKNSFAFYDEYSLPKFSYVRISRLASCQIIPSSTAKLSIEKSAFHQVKYYVKNDTLVINGNDVSTAWAPQSVDLYLPQVEKIWADNCSINVKGSKDSNDRRSYSFELDKGHLFTRQTYWKDTVNRHFDTFSVLAKNNSEVILYRNDYFKSIQLVLENSAFYERNAKKENINVRSDANSTLVTGGNEYQILRPME